MPAAPDPELQEIARQIEAYLDTRPRAADTVEGIASWWLARQRLSESVLKVQRALDLMLSSGRITALRRSGESIVYCRNPDPPRGENRNP